MGWDVWFFCSRDNRCEIYGFYVLCGQWEGFLVEGMLNQGGVGEQTGKNGGAQEMRRLTKSIVSGTCIEVVPVQESLWNFLIRRPAIPLVKLFLHLPPPLTHSLLLSL